MYTKIKAKFFLDVKRNNVLQKTFSFLVFSLCCNVYLYSIFMAVKHLVLFFLFRKTYEQKDHQYKKFNFRYETKRTCILKYLDLYLLWCPHNIFISSYSTHPQSQPIID